MSPIICGAIHSNSTEGETSAPAIINFQRLLKQRNQIRVRKILELKTVGGLKRIISAPPVNSLL